jgi:peptidoglycan/LPS O-acetylase OafA/YrhL
MLPSVAKVRSLPENLQSGLSPSHLPALDGLRAVAVFLVVFYHFGFTHSPAGLGVTIFFVLSGFLITWLLLKEHEKSRSISIGNFYLRRSLRILPAFYCYWLLCMALLVVSRKAVPWPTALASFFYFNNYYQALQGDSNTWFSHTWSLAVEEQFYLLWAPLFFLLCKYRRRLAWLLAGLIVSAWIYRELLVFVFRTNEGYIYEAFDTRLDQLLVGCLLAVLLRTKLLTGFWNALCSHPGLSALTTALLLGSVFLEIQYGTQYRDVCALALEPVLAALLLVQAIAFRSTIFWRWLQFPVVRYLGSISYSIYLYQQLALHPVRAHLHSFSVGAQLLVAVAVVILLASSSYFLVEKPFLTLKDRFSSGRAVGIGQGTAKLCAGPDAVLHH